MSENTSGCGCGCGKRRAARAAQQERAEAPAVVQPQAGVQERAADGVVPGRKAGNDLGLRDVSASGRGGCGCGRGGCGGHSGHRH